MKRFYLILTMLILLTALLAVLALKSGAVQVSWSEVAGVFTGDDNGKTLLLREIRLPRLLLALLAGSALGIAGAVLQQVLHNDLAAPEIMGISAGAGTAGVVWLLYCGASLQYLGFASFAGALLAAAAVYLAAWKRGIDPARLILAGVAVSTLAGAFTSALLLLNSDKLTGIFEFTLGGVAGKGWQELYCSLPFFLAAFTGCVLMVPLLELLALDDHSAASLGINVELTRLTALALAALAAGTAVSVAGLLGFVGLMAPHTARKLGGSTAGKCLLLSAVLGGILTLTGEWLGRTVAAPRELPAGMFLSAAGAIFFLTLLLRRNREEL